MRATKEAVHPFVRSMRDAERQRPVFCGQRFDNPGSFPYSAILARMDDGGALEVLMPIYESEIPAFIAWCRKTWA